MAQESFASDALAGLSGPSLDVLESPSFRMVDEDSPHYQFLETHLIPEMGKLTKELRGRRFKVSIFWQITVKPSVNGRMLLTPATQQ